MSKSPAKAAATPDDTPIAAFEQSLNELEALVSKMENGELSLDESLRSFERGVTLYRGCQKALADADARVKLLTDPEHPESAQPFATDADA